MKEVTMYLCDYCGKPYNSKEKAEKCEVKHAKLEKKKGVASMTRIKKIRKEKNLTQKELCKKAGIGDGQIQRYESGSRSPTVKILYKIADALEVNVSELM